MSQVIATLLGADGAYDLADAAAKPVYGSLCGFAQMRFDFAEAILDRVEIGRVLRQIPQRRIGRFNRLAHPLYFVRRQIIHNNDIATLERWDKKLPHPFDKREPVHCSFHHKRRHHAVVAQSGDERDRLPMSMRRIADQPHATRAAASQPHHVGAGGSLVDKDQPRRIKQTLLAYPTPACTHHVRSLLLGGVQAFF